MTSENGKSDQNETSDPPEVPEVEAEIVENEASVESGALFDEDEEPAQPPDKPEETTSDKQKNYLTPGVILSVGLAILAVAAFVFWRFQTAPQKPNQDDPVSTEEASPQTDDADVSGQVRAETPDSPPAPLPDEPSTEQDLSLPPEIEVSPDKIDNTGIDEIETPAPATIPQTDDTYLPPLPSEKDDSGKTGGRSFGEQLKDTLPENEPADTEDVTSDEQPFTFEIEEEAQPSRDDGNERAQDEEITGDGVAEALGEAAMVGEPSDIAGDESTALAKITNNTEAIKEIVRAETSALASALEEERARGASLEEEIEALRRQFSAVLAERDQQAAALSSMRADLDKIANTGGVSPAKLASGAIAFSALKRALETGAPFEAELHLLAQIEPNAEAIGVLQDQAGAGVPTLESLKADFGVAAREGLAAAGREEAGGPMARLAARAKSLVSVRPASPQAGDSPAAIISRAESAVQKNEISTALNELKSLSAAGREAMGVWMEKAEQRVRAESALEALGEQFLQRASN